MWTLSNLTCAGTWMIRVFRGTINRLPADPQMWKYLKYSQNRWSQLRYVKEIDTFFVAWNVVSICKLQKHWNFSVGWKPPAKTQVKKAYNLILRWSSTLGFWDSPQDTEKRFMGNCFFKPRGFFNGMSGTSTRYILSEKNINIDDTKLKERK